MDESLSGMEEREDLVGYCADFDADLDEMNVLFNHIDHLISWGDFLEKCRIELDQVNIRLNSIELMARSCSQTNDEIDMVFSVGVCWIGAVATYEGCLHNLLLNSLSVSSLQERITRFCLKEIAAKKFPMKGMTKATEDSVRKWLTRRTISDPRKMARNFDEIFDIKTEQPDSDFCDRLLDTRNSFAHRGGGREVSLKDLTELNTVLNDLAITYTKSLISEVQKIL